MPTRPKYAPKPGARFLAGKDGTLDRHRVYNRFGRDPALLKFYSKAPWRRFRAAIRAERILCERCKKKGVFVDGQQVHHKIDPRLAPDLALDRGNVELLCHSCHSKETASAGHHS